MKQLVVVFLLMFSFLAAGQSVTAPVAKSFSVSTNGQDASGFVLSGFAPNATILASISLVDFPTGTTFYLSTYANLTAASGFGLVGNKTRLVFTGTMASINTALASLKVNTGSIKGTVKLSVAATINPTGYYYNGVNGHFYKPVTTGAYYKDARAASLLTTFKGQTGYLVTITSASEDAFIQANVPATQIWFACTDEVTDGVWVIDAGPEKGTVIKTSNANSGNVSGQYNNWAGGEPNGYNHGEDYAVTKWNGNLWNDLYNQWNNPYVIEYGTWSNPDDQTFTDFYTNSTSHTNGAVKSTNFNFNFGGSIDKTTFSGKLAYFTNTWTNLSTTAKQLSGLGKVDMSADFDTTKTNMGFIFQQYPAANLTALTSQVVTVSDVYLAFREVSNRGLTGEGGNEFTSGIQYMNADIDGNGVFNESDAYLLLQHLIGVRDLTNNCNTLGCWMKLMSVEDYNSITKSNWNTYSNLTRDTYAPLTPIPGTYTYNYDINVFWKGDVNMSHTPAQRTVLPTSVGTMNRVLLESNTIEASIGSEILDNKVYVTITLDPKQEEVVGTQFEVKYDKSILNFDNVKFKSKGAPTNYGVDLGSSIRVGSIITNGNTTLDSSTEYVITFTSVSKITSALGLVSIVATDGVDKSGTQLNINIK